MLKQLSAAIVVSAIFAAPAFADSLDVFGTWRVESGNSDVEITDCGDGTPCGVVISMNPAMMPDGMTPETAEDAKGQKILGLTMLEGFNKKSKDWRSGSIYDPEAGKTYGSRLKKLDDGTLQVKGCMGPMCQTQIWQPAEDLEPFVAEES